MKSNELPVKDILCHKYVTRLENIDTFCSKAKGIMKARGHNDQVFSTELLIREAMANSMIHGNKGREDRAVCVKLLIMKNLIILRVTDEGQGFNWTSATGCLPEYQKTSWRDLIIYSQYASRIAFKHRGNSVILLRRTYTRGNNG